MKFHSLFSSTGWFKWGALLGALLCSSCASYYHPVVKGERQAIKRPHYKNDSKKWVPILVFSFGLGEQFKKPSK